MSYQKQATLGLIGAALVASPLLIRLPGQFKIRASEDLERFKISQRRQTADVLNKAGMLPIGDKLKIRHYYYNPRHDPKPETTGFLEGDRVWVYDSGGTCIGLIEKRTWKWRKYYPPICVGAPVL